MRKGSFVVWMGLVGMVIVGVVLWFGMTTARKGAVGMTVENRESRESLGEEPVMTDLEEVENMQKELEQMEDVDLTVGIDVSELP